MDVLTIVLIILIIVFFIGNILLSFLLSKKDKLFNFKSYDAKLDILNSKIDLLNKRISLLEENNKSLDKQKLILKKDI